jgi:hypothetical protein
MFHALLALVVMITLTAANANLDMLDYQPIPVVHLPIQENAPKL